MKRPWKLSQFRAGERIEVRSQDEILATLDGDGCLEGLPFMPEMLAYCGRQFVVKAVAHKTCETARGTWQGRRLPTAVHLEGLRCDGSAHGNCQAECNLFWKDAWLKPAGAVSASIAPKPPSCTIGRLYDCTLLDPGAPDSAPVYSCQATRVYDATAPLSPWNVRQYIRDIRTGNHRVRRALGVLWIGFLEAWLQRAPLGYRWQLRHLEWLHCRLLGRPRPPLHGTIAPGERTPSRSLRLQPGELVRVKSADEIAQTLDPGGRNRGLSFDREMAAYCGRTFRVLKVVTEIVDEATGKMMHIKHPCIMLEGVYCGGEYSQCRLLCPRTIPPYWREIWLERVPAPVPVTSESHNAVCASAAK